MLHDSRLAPRRRTIFGHPPGLFVLFLTQMWERFSYFGMLALLVLYMVNYFKWDQGKASSVFKWYTSVIYFTPLIGGYLADRYLGNRRAIVIGAVLMAVGHFLMAFEAVAIFYAALIFLVVGCGLLTPPLTTQVGLLYGPTDARRDAAYTIFYMGINLGAFASPLVCGWLVDNTRGGYHSGFTVAGIGMVIALVTYALGLRWVIELDQSPAAGPRLPETEAPWQQGQSSQPSSELISSPGAVQSGPSEPASPSFAGRSETAAPPSIRAASVFPLLNRTSPALLALLGAALAVVAPVLGLLSRVSWDAVLALELTAVCFLIFAWILTQVHGIVRDQVLSIFLMGFFVVFYWAGAGQGGNAINLWADQNTDRNLSETAQAPDLVPKPAEDDASTDAASGPEGFWERWVNLFKPLPAKVDPDAPTTWSGWWVSLWNPVPTAWFQSINPLLILLLAPFFAMLWVFLDRRGLNPSIPAKMALGILCMSLAFGVMLRAAQGEDRASITTYAGPLPAPIQVNEQGQLCSTDKGNRLEPYDAGRLSYDPNSQGLHLRGVLTLLERDRIVANTAPEKFAKQIEELKEKTEKETGQFVIQMQLADPPAIFATQYTGLSKTAFAYDAKSRTVKVAKVLNEQDVVNLKVAAGDADLRAALNDLVQQSSAYRVSSWWLFAFFFLATVGEFCLSPIGLSMVSKLAPAKFASMLMGLWLLTFSFGNLAAGWLGESWGTIPPREYFLILLGALGGGALVLFALRRRIVGMMHDVS